MDKIRCGVIGVGGMGAIHAEIIKDSKFGELVALCDIDQQTLKRRAKQFQVEKIYTDYKEMIKDPLLDMVSICLPHYLHGPVGIEAMKAGKHVLTEKPLATSLEEADKMIRASEENNVQLAVSEEHRYACQIQLAKRWIEEGKLGKLYLCSCIERFGRWDPKEWGWRSKKKMIGGGSYIDQGHHAVDLMRYIMGDPIECSAYMARPTRTLEGEEITLAIYKHPNGAISHIHAGWAPGPVQFKISIYGLKGTIISSDDIRRPGTVSFFSSQSEVRREDCSGPPPKYIAVENFLKAIAKNEPFEYSGREGKKNLAAILAAYESVEKGISVKIKY